MSLYSSTFLARLCLATFELADNVFQQDVHKHLHRVLAQHQAVPPAPHCRARRVFTASVLRFYTLRPVDLGRNHSKLPTSNAPSHLPTSNLSIDQPRSSILRETVADTLMHAAPLGFGSLGRSLRPPLARPRICNSYFGPNACLPAVRTVALTAYTPTSSSSSLEAPAEPSESDRLSHACHV
ncbi:hypothetical protein C8Q78DRAFT_762177 [Trametes maxima]|nr:hypothetical protein C8Q78DRAFT_762177 [Trametes maxima]